MSMTKDEFAKLTANVAAIISDAITDALLEIDDAVPEDAKSDVSIAAMAMIVTSFFDDNLEKFSELTVTLQGWDRSDPKGVAMQ